MFLTVDAAGKRVPPTKGAYGTCPRCQRVVHAKCGNQKIHHWAHEKGMNDCDPWAESTEPRRFRAWIAADGRAKFRWMSRRRTLDAAKRPVYLDLGGPLLGVTSYGPRGCVSGFGEMLSRTAGGRETWSAQIGLETDGSHASSFRQRGPLVPVSALRNRRSFRRLGQLVSRYAACR